MSDARSLFVARDADLDALRAHWSEALEGKPRIVRVQAPFGGGKRALAGEFLREVQARADDALIWRVTCLDQENGLQWLVRMYGSLIASLSQDILRRGKVEMVLNAALPSQPKRVQAWFQQFISSMKDARTDTEKGQVQLRLPQDNPLIGLVEVVHAVCQKVPMVLELQSPFAVNSLALASFVEGLWREGGERGGKLMIILHDEPPSDVTKALHPLPLLDLYERHGDAMHVLEVAPWGADEVQKYLDSKELTADAARLATIARGRPGFVAELIDILEEGGRLDGDLSEVTMASLVPLTVDEGELELPDEPPEEGQRKHAGPGDSGQVVYLAALLGQAFPSNLVADMGGYDRDSVDDLLDAMGDLFEEVQFSQELGTWIYKFIRGAWREGVIEQNDTDEGHELARRVGVFMERFLVPRGYGYIVKTARVYAEHGGADRAGMMRSTALTNDNPDMWALAWDFTRYFDEIEWPDALKRTVYMNLIERLVNQGNVQLAEQVYSEVSTFATEREDRDLTAWLLYAGSRLDTRRQDLFRARDRARDAMKLYEALENKPRMAELHNHMATIELQDGNGNAALQHVEQALELGSVDTEDGKKAAIPGVLASGEHIRGMVQRRAGKAKEAAEHFRRANEVAGQTGLAQLALDSGLSYGEALLASGQTQPARDALERVLQIARALRNPARERNACELLAQAEGALRNFDKALPLATRTLELTRALKFEQALPVDLYNLGFFHFVTKKPAEALSYFNEASPRMAALGKHPVVKEFFFYKGLAHMQTGDLDNARDTLKAGLPQIEEHKDWRKMCAALENLASIEQQQGNGPVAKKLLGDAIGFAEQHNLRDVRKELRKKLQTLG